jgi:hypothetical protein
MLDDGLRIGFGGGLDGKPDGDGLRGGLGGRADDGAALRDTGAALRFGPGAALRPGSGGRLRFGGGGGWLTTGRACAPATGG